MAWDAQTDSHAPMMHISIKAKAEELCYYALSWVIADSKCQIDPTSVAVDFDLGLHNEVHSQFDVLEVNGCLFHFK